MKRSILIAMILLISVEASADEVDVFSQGGLLESCEAAAENEGAARVQTPCLFYTAGTVEAYLGAFQVEKRSLPFCPPDGITTHQVVRIAVKYFRDHPETDHHPAAASIIRALYNAYPCNSPK